MESLRIALRYLLAKRSQNAISVISLISVIGVGVATMAIVCVLSVFNGFADLATTQADRLTPDLRITPRVGKVIGNVDSVRQVVATVSGVGTIVKTLEERALIKSADNQMPVRLKGVSEGYSDVTAIESAVKDDGEFVLSDSLLGPAITLSVGAAIELHERPGADSRVELYVPRRKGRINPANPAAAFRSREFTVGGVFQVEDAEADADMVIVSYDEAARLLDRQGAASALEIELADDADANIVAKQLGEALGHDYVVATRRQQNQTSLRMIAVEKWITFAMLAFILVIASFNIISTLSMMVIEKTDNIRTLFALGASRSFIAGIFRYEGWLISLAGGVGGILVGVALCLVQQWFGVITLGGDHEVMVTDVYPVRVQVSDLLVVLVLAAGVGWATASITASFSRRRLSLRPENFLE